MSRKTPNGYWTKDRCKQIASNYSVNKEFREQETACYDACCRNGWVAELTQHMTKRNKDPGYWTKARCRKVISKYSTKKEFRKENYDCYRACQKNGWVIELTQHLLQKKPLGYWTKEKCRLAALECASKTSFQAKYSKAYAMCLENGWLDDFCEHMKIKGTGSPRCIYTFRFRKEIYVGLTDNFRRRKKEHKEHGSTYQKLAKKGKVIFKQETNYISEKKAQRKESQLLIFYQNKGFKILNKAKTGALGGTEIIYTKEICKEEASRHRTISTFSKTPHYNACSKNGWLEDVTGNLERLEKPPGYWSSNKARCAETALKYSTKMEFKSSDGACYSTCVAKGWLKELTTHMTGPKPKGYWSSNKARCAETALKYSTKMEFKSSDGACYDASRRNGWLKELTSHMP